MTLALCGVAVLGVGAVLSLLLARTARLALLGAMAAIVVASGLSIAGAVPVLVNINSLRVVSEIAWPTPLGMVSLAMDGLSAWFVLTVSILAIAVAIYSPAYMREEIAGDGRLGVATFGALMCLLLASMIVVFCAADAVVFLVGWEVMTLSGFFLVGYHDERQEVRFGAWMYLIATHLGTALFLLPMFATLIARSGSIGFSAIAAAIGQQGMTPRVGSILFTLGLLGFGTKAGFMPMHVWLPNAHPVAPTPVSAFLSGVVIKCGIYGILRLLTILPPLPARCAIIMLIFGAVSGVLGVLYALAQHDIKRLLAYHSVENIGIIGLGIGMGMLGQTMNQPVLSALGYAGAMLHVLNHALFKGLLFLSAGAVIHSTGTGEIDRLGALARKTPMNAALFLIAAVSICGLPPFNGFVSEWLIYRGLFGGAMDLPASSASAAVIGLTSLALMGGLALACFAKVFSVVFLGEAREPDIHVHATPRSMVVAMALPALLCVVIGVVPGLVIPLTRAGTLQLMGASAGGGEEALRSAVGPAGRLTLVALVLIGIALALVAIRALARRRNAPVRTGVSTWGCGYAYASPRIQYTASSFAWSLIGSFRSMLWPQRELNPPIGPFPAPGRLHTHTADIAESDLFTPLFAAVARLSRMIQTVSWTGRPQAIAPKAEGRVGPLEATRQALLMAVRRGTIQTCVTYIVLALMVLFFVEALAASRTPNHETQNPASEKDEMDRSR